MPETTDETKRQRNLLFLSRPDLWPTWPFLAVVRCREPGDCECGLVCDLERLLEVSGYRCTVLLHNLFCLPARLEDLLELPRETFDTFEDLFEAGWQIDGPDSVDARGDN